MEPSGERVGRREILAEQAAVLAGEVGRLRAAVAALDRRASRSSRVLAGVVLTLALDVVLSLALGFTIASQFTTNTRLDETVAQENIIRSEVLCPLYAVFLGSYAPQSRPEGAARQQYEQAFTTIREGYVKLRCTTPPVPARSDPPR